MESLGWGPPQTATSSISVPYTGSPQDLPTAPTPASWGPLSWCVCLLLSLLSPSQEDRDPSETLSWMLPSLLLCQGHLPGVCSCWLPVPGAYPLGQPQPWEFQTFAE